MNVLHILGELQHSGAERLLTSAAGILISGGNHHSVLSTGTIPGNYANSMRESGFDIIHLPFQKNIWFFLKLREIIKRDGIDVVHIHMERGSFWTALTALSTGARPIRTIHNEFAFTGMLRLRRGLQRRILVWLGVPHVACSEKVATNEKERFRITTYLIENWIDCSSFRPISVDRRSEARSKLRVPDGTFVAVSVGNNSIAKNYDVIIDAIRDCASTMPISFYHCGGGEDELAKLAGLSDADPIYLEGPVRNVEDYLAAADAFVSASAFEGASLALMEAAAMGLPCISTRVGMASLLADLPNIYFVDPTPESIASVIRSIESVSLKSRHSLGLTLSSFILSRFNPGKGAARYAQLYDAAVRRPELTGH